MQLPNETFDRAMSEEESENNEEAKMAQRDQDMASLLVPLNPGGVDVVLEELDELPDEWLREGTEIVQHKTIKAPTIRTRIRTVTLSGGREPA